MTIYLIHSNYLLIYVVHKKDLSLKQLGTMSDTYVFGSVPLTLCDMAFLILEALIRANAHQSQLPYLQSCSATDQHGSPDLVKVFCIKHARFFSGYCLCQGLCQKLGDHLALLLCKETKLWSFSLTLVQSQYVIRHLRYTFRLIL